MALDQNYYNLWFHSFRPANPSAHRDPIQLKLVDDQELPSEITDECGIRSINPFELVTECSKDFFYQYPVGTRFLLKAKLTDRERVGMFFYTSYRWKPIKVEEPN
jgi:hypothetical protein